jgi:hypothetical protein
MHIHIQPKPTIPMEIDRSGLFSADFKTWKEEFRGAKK